jgi:hypothetical protein
MKTDEGVRVVAKPTIAELTEPQDDGEGAPDGLSQDNPIDEETTIKLAKDAAGRLLSGNTFDDWVAVGNGVIAVRMRAMRAAKTNRPEGRKYAEAFEEELAEAGLEKIAGDKAVRSRLHDILENLNEVEAWLQTLPSNKRLEYNHPNTVWRHFSKYNLRVTEDQRTVMMLENQNTELKKKLDQKDKENADLKSNSTMLMPKETPEQIVEKLTSKYSEPVLKQIRNLLSKQIDGDAPQEDDQSSKKKTARKSKRKTVRKSSTKTKGQQ